MLREGYQAGVSYRLAAMLSDVKCQTSQNRAMHIIDLRFALAGVQGLDSTEQAS